MNLPTQHLVRPFRSGATALLLITFSLSSLPAANLIPQPNFDTWADGKPAGWMVRSPQTYQRGAGPDGAASLKVDIAKAVEGKSGEVLQTVNVQSNTNYVLRAQLRSDAPGGAALQVKRLDGGKEVERLASPRVKSAAWSPTAVKFNSGSSQTILVLLRWSQDAGDVGHTAEFAGISLDVATEEPASVAEVPPHAEATYNCLGLYWKPKEGAPDRAVAVNYRRKGDPDWKEALPLWFDNTEHDGEAAAHTHEYRGSIVSLAPDTTYEIKLSMNGGSVRTFEAHTRSDIFKIVRRVRLASPGASSLTIKEGGSDDGYVLYEPADPSKPWDGGGTALENIRVEASRVILKGFSFKNAKRHGIVLGNVQDVVIEDCDVSGWGETGEDGQAKDLNAAIYGDSPELERITVQNCRLHHPRSDSNSWTQVRPGTTSKHPQGPQAIVFRNSKGGHVIRFNRIYSDLEHMFNDSMGDTHNFSYQGFPGRDSDIQGNFVANTWDDGVEVEGADMNVRVWDNYVDTTNGAFGAAAPSLGPLYIYRNVYAVSRRSEGNTSTDLRGHYLVKLGNEGPKWTKGKMYIFHNTSLQPLASPSFSETRGAQAGLVFTSDKKLQENITSRNNLLQMRTAADWAIRDTQKTPSNDFDYDMFDGRTLYKEGSEAHGIAASPTYRRTEDGRLVLVPGTAGYDAGVKLPNFNDDYVGQGPDVGAVEADSKDAKPVTWPNFPECRSGSAPTPSGAATPVPKEESPADP